MWRSAALGLKWGQSIAAWVRSPCAGERRAHLNHLVGVGVVEHQFREGSTAGWNENHQTVMPVVTVTVLLTQSYVDMPTAQGILSAESLLKKHWFSFWHSSGRMELDFYWLLTLLLMWCVCMHTHPTAGFYWALAVYQEVGTASVRFATITSAWPLSRCSTNTPTVVG